ncbi:hypothetical protein BLA29_010599, partial [Euroglyphus maynei]
MVTSGGFVGHGNSVRSSFPLNGRYFYASPVGHSSYIKPIRPFHGSSRIVTSAPFRTPIYSPISMIATQPSSSYRRFRRSVDGLHTHDQSQTVYYGMRQHNDQQQQQQLSYDQSEMNGYTGSSNQNYDATEETLPKPYQFSLQSQDDGTGSANWHQQEQSNGDGVI